ELPCDAPLATLVALKNELQDVMWRDAALFRSEARLEKAATALVAIARKTDAIPSTRAMRIKPFDPAAIQWCDLHSLLATSQAVVAAALERRESRGAHYRLDYPEELPDAATVRVRQAEGARGKAAVVVT